MAGREVPLEPAAYRAGQGLRPRLAKYPGWRGVKRAAPKKKKARKAIKSNGSRAGLAKARAVVKRASAAYRAAGKPKGQWKAYLQRAKKK